MIILFCVRYSLISHKYCPIIGLSFVIWVFVSTCVCVSKSFFYELRDERKYFHFQIFKVFLFKMFKGITKSKAKFQLLIVYMECKFMIIFTLSFASYCLFRPSTRNVWVDLRPYKYDEFDGTSLARYLYLKFKINRHC